MVGLLGVFCQAISRPSVSSVGASWSGASADQPETDAIGVEGLAGIRMRGFPLALHYRRGLTAIDEPAIA